MFGTGNHWLAIAVIVFTFVALIAVLVHNGLIKFEVKVIKDEDERQKLREEFDIVDDDEENDENADENEAEESDKSDKSGKTPQK